MSEVVSTETDGTPKQVLNGAINVRLTHPGLFFLMALSGVVFILQGLNFVAAAAGFYIPEPTFLIFRQSNYLWGGIFLALGVSKLFFLSVHKNLLFLLVTQALALTYSLCLIVGTSQPFADKTGSLQLPIWIAGWSALLTFLLLEPFINRTTSRQ